MSMEECHPVFTHAGAFSFIQSQKALQKRPCSFQRVIFHEAGMALNDVRPDIDFVGDKNRACAGHCFSNSYSEIFLMRGKNECLAIAKGTPFGITVQHSWPMDTLSNSKFHCQRLEFGFQTNTVWACHHKV